MSKAKVTAEPGQPLIHIERIFDAPRNKVFAAMTTKDKVAKWWVGPGYKTDVETLDARSGGSRRYVQKGEGNEFAFHGVYHVVRNDDKGSLVIQTMEFEGVPDQAAMERMELTDTEDGRTKMTVVSSFSSVEARDGMVQSGMEEGMQNTYNQLDEVLAGM
jgi:uncharacterized protein YndB with AHSA1/START domain